MGNLTNDTVTIVTVALITDKQYVIILESSAVVWTVLSLLGVVSNVINIRIFVAMGVKDGVTVSFLALAIFDLIYLITSLSLGISVIFHIIELQTTTRFPVQPYGILINIGAVMILVNITNVLATTFIAVARCMCVAMPLQFKNMFTRKIAATFMLGFAFISIILYTPILANMGMAVKFDKLANTSRLSLWGSPIRGHVKEIVWMITELILPISTQVIIIVCVVVMINCMTAASRFRQTALGKLPEKDNKTQNSKRKEKKTQPTDATNVTTDKLTGKDLRVVQQVVLISVIYIVCNIPKILISLVSIFEPEYGPDKAYKRLYECTNGLRKHFEILNSAVDLIIYYKYNTKFRLLLGLYMQADSGHHEVL